MIRCPQCNSKTHVLDTRAAPVHNYIRRRRECLNRKCKFRFTTKEMTIPDLEHEFVLQDEMAKLEKAVKLIEEMKARSLSR